MTRRSAEEQDTGGDGQGFVTLGHVSGPHGLQGWVKVHSDTSPRDNIVGYSPWYLVRDGERSSWRVNAGRSQGKAVVAKLAGCNDRETGEGLTGSLIQVHRDQLPEVTTPGEFYWDRKAGIHFHASNGPLGPVFSCPCASEPKPCSTLTPVYAGYIFSYGVRIRSTQKPLEQREARDRLRRGAGSVG